MKGAALFLLEGLDNLPYILPYILMEKAKLFKNGSSQAVRLPKEFRFTGSEVYIRKMGDMVVLIPQKSAWKDWLSNLSECSDDFMIERNQPEAQERDPL